MPSFLIRLIFWRGYRLGVSFANGSTSEMASHIVGRTWRRWTKAGANVLLAVKCCLESMPWPGFFESRACRAAAA